MLCQGSSFFHAIFVSRKSQHVVSEDWHSVTSIARAFSIGDKEAKSVSYLQTKVEKTMVEKLRTSVRTRGMRQWLTHDVLAAEMFNVGWSSGKTGSLIAWQAELTNLADNVLASQRHINPKICFQTMTNQSQIF